MLAQRTDEIRGKFFPFVEITAYGTAPCSFSGNRLCWFWLDCGLIIGVGCGRDIREHLHIFRSGNEQHVSTQVDGLFHGSADIGVGSGGKIVKTVIAAFAVGIIGKFVGIPSGLETEMSENIKISCFTENGKVKFLTFFYKFLCIICFVTAMLMRSGSLAT